MPLTMATPSREAILGRIKKVTYEDRTSAVIKVVTNEAKELFDK